MCVLELGKEFEDRSGESRVYRGNPMRALAEMKEFGGAMLQNWELFFRL